MTQYLQFKEGIKLTTSKAVNKILAAGHIAAVAIGKPCVVTSGSDGQHQVHSKHYTDEALDFRRFHLEPHECDAFVQSLKDTLGQEFDVVVEGNHFHVEYDKKGK